MRDRTKEKQFGIYISTLRRKRGFQLRQVSEGLCTEQMLFYLEKGKRTAPKLLQDALLERLGVGAVDYEHYLPYKEYDRWEARQRILYCIASERAEEAVQRLEQYRVTYVKGPGGDRSVSDRLERQFYLSMLAQIRYQQGADRAELHSLYGQAAGVTVPGIWCRPLKEVALSLKELNLILETEQYREGGEDPEHYRELMAYIETAGLDGVGMAKLYPKTVYFLCRCLGRGNTAGEAVRQSPESTREAVCRGTETAARQLLVYCNRALECLRDNSRMYYLWELLEIKGKLLGRMAGELFRKSEQKKAECLESVCRENNEWKEILESVYTEFGIPKETFSSSYLYVEKGAACINDVIRIRRGMLGMSEEALCEGICDVKTLRRLEKRKAVSQREIVEELFERLGLPRELTRTELATERPEARWLMEKLRTCINNRRMEEAETLLARIKEQVLMEIPCNRQVLMRTEVILKKKCGELNEEEYFRQLRMALELTLPYEAFLKEGEKFLTYEEQRCIQNMMQGMDKASREFWDCMKHFEEIYSLFEKTDLIETVGSMYEFIMGYVGSEWGNQGAYDQADRYNRIIVTGCLRFRRLHSIAAGLYDRWWNYKERKRRGIPVDKVMNGEDELIKCLVFSRLDKQKYYEPFYQKKLEQEQGV